MFIDAESKAKVRASNDLVKKDNWLKKRMVEEIILLAQKNWSRVKDETWEVTVEEDFFAKDAVTMIEDHGHHQLDKEGKVSSGSHLHCTAHCMPQHCTLHVSALLSLHASAESFSAVLWLSQHY